MAKSWIIIFNKAAFPLSSNMNMVLVGTCKAVPAFGINIIILTQVVLSLKTASLVFGSFIDFFFFK